MKRVRLVLCALVAWLGLLGCTSETPVLVSGPPIALTTDPASPAKTRLVPLGGYPAYELGYYALDTGEVRWRLALDDIGYLSEDTVDGILHLVDIRDGREIQRIEANCTPNAFFGPQTPMPSAFLHFDQQGQTIHL